MSFEFFVVFVSLLQTMLAVLAVGVECTNIGPYIHYISFGACHSVKETCIVFTVLGSVYWDISIS